MPERNIGAPEEPVTATDILQDVWSVVPLDSVVDTATPDHDIARTEQERRGFGFFFIDPDATALTATRYSRPIEGMAGIGGEGFETPVVNELASLELIYETPIPTSFRPRRYKQFSHFYLLAQPDVDQEDVKMFRYRSPHIRKCGHNALIGAGLMQPIRQVANNSQEMRRVHTALQGAELWMSGSRVLGSVDGVDFRSH